MRPEVAAELGLPSGVQVVTGTPDLHSAAVGAGAVADYQTHLAISTTSWISCPVPFKKTDAIRQIATVPGLTPGRATSSPTTTRRAAPASSGCATTCSPPDGRPEAAARATTS